MKFSQFITTIVLAMLYFGLLFFIATKPQQEITDYKIITYKSYHTFGGDNMPNGICRFMYENEQFEDSCHFYNVGDTIIGRTKQLK